MGAGCSHQRFSPWRSQGARQRLQKLMNNQELILLLRSEVRYVNANPNYNCCGVVLTRWWRLGILTLAQLAPTDP